MKKVLIYNFELFMLCSLLYAVPMHHKGEVLLREILATLKNLTDPRLNNTTVPVIQEICDVDFFCHAEKSLETVKNITGLPTLCNELKKYNKKMNHTTCSNLNGGKMLIQRLLKEIKNCTEAALNSHKNLSTSAKM